MGQSYRLANHTRQEFIHPYGGLKFFEQQNFDFMWSYLLWPYGPWVGENVSLVGEMDDGNCDKKEKYVFGYSTPNTNRLVDPKYTELDPDRKTKLPGYLKWLKEHGLDWDDWRISRGFKIEDWVEHLEEWEEYHLDAVTNLPNRYLVNHQKKEYVNIDSKLKKLYAPYMWFLLLKSCNDTANRDTDCDKGSGPCARWGKGKAVAEVSFNKPEEYKDITGIVMEAFPEYYEAQTDNAPADLSDDPVLEGTYHEELVVRSSNVHSPSLDGPDISVRASNAHKPDKKHKILFAIGITALAFFLISALHSPRLYFRR